MNTKVSVVGVSEIADMFKVTKQAVSNYRERYSDFPIPVATLKMGSIWLEKEIKAWGKKAGKI